MIEKDFWPSSDLFIDISNIEQITDGSARCTAVAICDADGRATRVFRQGEAIHFFYEFELLDTIHMVAGGLEFHDARNQVIHGKNSFQFHFATQSAEPGTRLRYHHVINAEVSPDEYWITIGCSSTNERAFQAYTTGEMGHIQFNENLVEHCRVIDVGSFVVTFDIHDRLLHYGIANLPSTCDVTTVASSVNLAQPAQSATVHTSPTTNPTIFHVTHWKAGSQWLHRILLASVPDLIVAPRLENVQFCNWPIQEGKVYPTVYVTKQEFDRVRKPENSRHFVIIRDLRDTLVSAYFSMKFSHPVQESNLARLREVLQSLNVEDGLIHTIRQWLPGCADVQLSWVQSGERLIRYEDLLQNDLEILEPLLLDYCELPISRQRFREVVTANRFSKLTKGRERGVEDVHAHERKGISGDWQNYFTDKVRQEFNERYGSLLIASGYVKDLNW